MTLNVTPTSNKNIVHVTLSDRYDFNHLKYDGYDDFFGILINNIAYHLQNVGVVQNYDFNIQFDYTIYPEND